MLQQTMLHDWPAMVMCSNSSCNTTTCSNGVQHDDGGQAQPQTIVHQKQQWHAACYMVTCSHKTMCSNGRCRRSSNRSKSWLQSMLQQHSIAHQQHFAAFPIGVRAAAAAATKCCNRHVQPTATCANSRQYHNGSKTQCQHAATAATCISRL